MLGLKSSLAPPPVPCFLPLPLTLLCVEPGVSSFASLFQSPRTEEETALFLLGLRASNVWYGHEGSVCWMQKKLPEGFAEQMRQTGLAQTYDESGWCFIEAAIFAGVKKGTRRLDLSLRTGKVMYYGGRYWGQKHTLEGVCAAHRSPPLQPDVVRRLLETEKCFTAKADIEVVDQLYRDFFDGIIKFARELEFCDLR